MQDVEDNQEWDYSLRNAGFEHERRSAIRLVQDDKQFYDANMGLSLLLGLRYEWQEQANSVGDKYVYLASTQIKRR